MSKNNLELLVATKNKGKLREIKIILKDLPLKITSLADYPGHPRIIENAKTFSGNAAKKALALARFTGKLVMGEDSGLCVDALKGAPGVYSARFAGKNKSDDANNKKLLRLLKGLPASKRKAYYVCAIALADKKGLVKIVEGKCFGRIGFDSRGKNGFGYDPLFVIPIYNKTFGQLSGSIKHKISHRFRALQDLRKVLKNYVERAEGV
ncbi:MAG: XTP/dITP diphosphatase [Candidatus Omnitrophica bacterium]|jgi:XTP/dITP diphosphohydrolase|nr:XTP/dITP diphosphatase [Candidatus Omnitrophota bacterium]